jgi:hypothetical protein
MSAVGGSVTVTGTAAHPVIGTAATDAAMGALKGTGGEAKNVAGKAAQGVGGAASSVGNGIMGLFGKKSN